jgi:hypothetical protein
LDPDGVREDVIEEDDGALLPNRCEEPGIHEQKL